MESLILTQQINFKVNLMNRIQKLFSENRGFIVCFLAWYFILSGYIFSRPDIQAFQLTNSNHSLFFDYFFTVITQFGDGLFVMTVALVCFLVWSRRLGVAIAVTYIGSGLICSLLKKTFQAYRPGYLLQDDPTFHALSWMPMAHHNAFPSGHTTSAFALAATLAFFAKNKKIGLLAFVLACLTGYSRVYLGQHFWDDVWFGSMLGMGFTCLYAVLLAYYTDNKFTVIQFPNNFRI